MEFLNTNISGEMAQYLMSVQSKYVPPLKKDGGNVVLERVFPDGDNSQKNVRTMFSGFSRMAMTRLWG